MLGRNVLAVSVLNDKQKFPLGSFLQTWLDGELIGARVEWHTEQGATCAQGCFRGVNLMQELG